MIENMTIEQKANTLIGCTKIGGCKSKSRIATAETNGKHLLGISQKNFFHDLKTK